MAICNQRSQNDQFGRHSLFTTAPNLESGRSVSGRGEYFCAECAAAGARIDSGQVAAIKAILIFSQEIVWKMKRQRSLPGADSYWPQECGA